MKKQIALTVIFILTICNAFAQQNEISDKKKKKIAKQQHLDSLTQIAIANKPKPDIKYGFAIKTGATWIAGDVHNKPVFKLKPFKKSIPGYNFGAEYNITIERIFTLNFGATYNKAFGQDYLPITNIEANGDLNSAITGSNFYTENYNTEIGITPNYAGQTFLPFVNYKTTFYEMYVNTVLNLNITNGFYLNLLSGLGYLNYNTKMDLLDNNNQIYDFSTIINVGDNLDNINIAQQQITNLLDGTYESQAEIIRNENTSNKTSLLPIYFGAGFTYVLSKKLNVGIIYQLSLTNDDLIDGQQRFRNGIESNNNDKIHAINIKFGFPIKINSTEH